MPKKKHVNRIMYETLYVYLFTRLISRETHTHICQSNNQIELFRFVVERPRQIDFCISIVRKQINRCKDIAFNWNISFRILFVLILLLHCIRIGIVEMITFTSFLSCPNILGKKNLEKKFCCECLHFQISQIRLC